jgi:hypothetical protein
MKIIVKFLLLLTLISMSLLACSSDNSNNPQDEEDLQTGQNHRYSFTVSGNGINNESFTTEIPFEDHGGGMSYFEPDNDYVMVYVYLNNRNPGIRVSFVYLNDVIQPLAVNELTNQNTSVVFVNFSHQGQNYTLESVSGTCVSHLVETFPFGALDSGKSTFKIGFSGTFRNIFDHSQTFQITNGEIEVYNN